MVFDLNSETKYGELKVYAKHICTLQYTSTKTCYNEMNQKNNNLYEHYVYEGSLISACV